MRHLEYSAQLIHHLAELHEFCMARIHPSSGTTKKEQRDEAVQRDIEAKLFSDVEPKLLTIHGMRRYIIANVDPLKLVMKLAQGKPVEGIPDPTPTQVETAIYALLKRVSPEMKTLEFAAFRSLDDDRDPERESIAQNFAGELLTLVGLSASLKAGGHPLPPILDQSSEAKPATTTG